MKIDLAYGKKGILIEIPDIIHTEVVEPGFVDGIPDQMAAVSQALSNPVNQKPLHELVKPDQKVAIIFSDITRATPYNILVPALLKALSHLPDQNI